VLSGLIETDGIVVGLSGIHSKLALCLCLSRDSEVVRVKGLLINYPAISARL
jgi:hypothetical protein